MKRIAVLGGSFNPVHNGHIELAEKFCGELLFDEVLFIPVSAPPHKDASDLAADNHRFAMCELACAEKALFRVSDIEMSRGGASYTVDTLIALKSRYPASKLYLLMGSDMYLTLLEWHRSGELLKLAVMCVASRDNEELEKLHDYKRGLERIGGESAIGGFEVRPISSTLIRGMIKSGEDIDGLVPDKVRGYINFHGLYG